MTAVLLDRPAPDAAPSDGGGDDSLNHIWHCDENVAVCGVDLTGVPDVDPDESTDPMCVVCEATWLAGLPCPVPGCPRGPGDGEP